jgi:hypothetical protein
MENRYAIRMNNHKTFFFFPENLTANEIVYGLWLAEGFVVQCSILFTGKTFIF